MKPKTQAIYGDKFRKLRCPAALARALFSATFFMFGSIVGADSLHAQEAAVRPLSVEVEIEAEFKPTSVVGLLTNKSGAIQKPNLEAKQNARGTWSVVIPVLPSELDESTTATAIALGSDDRIAFGRVREISPGSDSSSYLNLPACTFGTSMIKPNPNTQAIGGGKLALLESLVKVRAKRRETLTSQLKILMSPEMITRLAKLEKGFGLDTSPALSTDLPPAVLVERLTKLLATLQSYDQKRAREQSAKSK